MTKLLIDKAVVEQAARDLEKTVSELSRAVVHMQCDGSGNGPDCSQVFQAQIDATSSAGKLRAAIAQAEPSSVTMHVPEADAKHMKPPPHAVVWPAAPSAAQKDCQQQLMKAGQPYPRTCKTCGLWGPCRYASPSAAPAVPAHRVKSWGHCSICHHDRIPDEGCARKDCPDAPAVPQESVAWVERWYGSGSELGWWIVCGRDHIAHLGTDVLGDGDTVRKIVDAHNKTSAHPHPAVPDAAKPDPLDVPGERVYENADELFDVLELAAKPETKGERAELKTALARVTQLLKDDDALGASFALSAVEKLIDALLAAGPAIPAPHECKTEDEKLAYAFGWWKALEHARATGPAHVEPLTDEQALELFAQKHPQDWADYTSKYEGDATAKIGASSMFRRFIVGLRAGEVAHGIGKDQAS